jgi:hypothetical protein
VRRVCNTCVPRVIFVRLTAQQQNFLIYFLLATGVARVKNEQVECHAGEISHHYVDDKWWHKQEIL